MWNDRAIGRVVGTATRIKPLEIDPNMISRFLSIRYSGIDRVPNKTRRGQLVRMQKDRESVRERERERETVGVQLFISVHELSPVWFLRYGGGSLTPMPTSTPTSPTHIQPHIPLGREGERGR